jgi:hypothetical protein
VEGLRLAYDAKIQEQAQKLSKTGGISRFIEYLLALFAIEP